VRTSPPKAIAAIAFAIAITSACSSGSNHNAAKAKPTTPTTPTTTTPVAYPLDSTLRLNQVQELGSHNSYHAEPYPQILAKLRQVDPPDAVGLDYGHRPLPQQFALGVRQIELDVWSDPLGGKYAHPSLPQSLHIPPPDPAVMDKPGFKVIHVADVDTNSTCLT